MVILYHNETDPTVIANNSCVIKSVMNLANLLNGGH
jgi:hypothetical protein